MARSRFPARAVLLDWDGTLLDSYHADARAYLAMFRAMEIPWGLEDLARHYSPDWYHVYRAARLPRARWEMADRLWRQAYAQERPKLLPGARRVLRVLGHRFKLGLVTSGSRARVRKQLREFEFAKLFSACVCSEDAEKRKPHPAPLQLALGRLRLAPQDCIYVGDSAEDIEMARRAGVRSIAILGPFPTHDRVRAADPNLLLESISELPSWIEVSPAIVSIKTRR